MKRRYRLRSNQRFQEVRRKGETFSNEYLVLCALPNDLSYSRCGFSVSRRIGNAVARNLIKRRLREAVRLKLAQIVSGRDLVFVARYPIRDATYPQIEDACARLLRRAHLLKSDALMGPPAAPLSVAKGLPSPDEAGKL